jgi:hypothetical protein
MSEPDKQFSGFLQTTSQVLAISAGFVYLFGFIIVSAFDATLGISDFSLFRAKVVATGTVFGVLVAAAVITMARTFSLFGLTTFATSVIPGDVLITPKNKNLSLARTATNMPFIGFGIVLVFGPVVTAIPIWQPNTWLFLVPAAVTVLFAVIEKIWLNNYPRLFVCLYALSAAVLFLLIFRYSGHGTFWLLVWFSAVSVAALLTIINFREPDNLRKTEWERYFFPGFAVVVLLYATKVYPNVRHQFGGGEPVPIVMHLTKKLPVFDSETVPVLLIDETEQGYYVVHGSDRALFVKRDLVEEVEFLHPGQAAQTSTK